jgi:hypothetical protein
VLVSIEFITTWHATNMVARRNERKKSKALIHKYKRCRHNDGVRGKKKKRFKKGKYKRELRLYFLETSIFMSN